jgi:hypothetical protein
LGKKFSEETKAKMRKPKTAEHAENIRKAMRGRIFTSAWKAKISKGRRAMLLKRTAEQIEKANAQLEKARAAKQKVVK